MRYFAFHQSSQELSLAPDPATELLRAFPAAVSPPSAPDEGVAMKGRMGSILWGLVAFNVVCVAAVLGLAYSAGMHSGGLSLLDFGALPASAGLRLWIAALALVLSIFSLAWGATRVLNPLKSLADYSDHLGNPDTAPLLRVESDDDFGYIADQLTHASETLAAAKRDQEALEALRTRVSALTESATHAARGNLGVRADAGEDDLGRAAAALNTTLSAVSATLASGRDAAEQAAAAAGDALAAARATDNALLEHGVNAQRAGENLAQLPPAIQQVADNAAAIAAAGQQAATAAEQAHHSAAAAALELEQVRASLAVDADALTLLRHTAERLEARLRELSLVAERANILALNAAVAAVRAAEATRTPLTLVEEFRTLAQTSSDTSGELQSLITTVRHHCDELLQATAQQQARAGSAFERSQAAAQSAEQAAVSGHEAAARGEVIALAAGRQHDAAAALQSLLRSLGELGQSAAGHARRAAAAAERSRRLGAEASQALGALRTQAAAEEAPPPSKAAAASVGD